MAISITENNIFRFVARRPIQRAIAEGLAHRTVYCFEVQGTKSALHQALLAAAQITNPRAEMLRVARRFIDASTTAARSSSSGGAEPLGTFIRDLTALNTPIGALDEWLYASPVPVVFEALLAVVSRLFHTFGHTPKEIVDTPEFMADFANLRDSVIAVTVDALRPQKHSDRLVRAVRICRLLQRMANEKDTAIRQPGGIETCLRAMVLLPPDLFPLPSAETLTPRAAAFDVQLAEREKAHQRRERLAQLRNALNEFERLGRTDFARRPEPQTESVQRRADSRQKPLLLSRQAIDGLSGNTKALLAELGFDSDQSSFPELVETLQRELVRVGTEHYRPGAPLRMIRRGSSTLAFHRGIATAGPAPSPPAGAVSVPETVGSARPVGVADLLIVRQKLLGYEAGEVAHIENVLRGEYKERRHRRAQRVEEAITVETERKEESEKDLQSTERFELKREASETIKEDTKLAAGLTVSGSYGPSISFNANTSFAWSESKENSERVSTTYARDVTERSVSRVQERVREERVRRTVEEFEEINTHGIDNKEKTDHAIGIYRWVDKNYQAQVVNYGIRTLFEFTVPEPAAFYLHALRNQPPEGTLEMPEPLLVHADGTPVSPDDDLADTRPLQPADITEERFQYWVAKYQASNVKAPPLRYRTISQDIKEDATTGNNKIFKSQAVTVEPGYITNSAYFWWYTDNSFTDDGDDSTYLELSVGTTPVSLAYDFNNVHIVFRSFSQQLYDHRGDVLIGLAGGGFKSVLLSIVLFSERTEDALKTWQQTTYDAIVQAYLVLKGQYEQQLAAAATQEGISISGHNPDQNREIEKTELKKAAISLLTRQHFDLFDAMRNGAYGFPEMDFTEAEAEGRYVQFLEQAFEWPNVTYLYYPYFWGRKQETWIDKLTQIVDTDPMFEQFLTAGAARVVVPVRPGYEAAIAHFMAGGGPWDGGDPPQVDDELYVSLIDEIREQQGMFIEKDAGTIAITNGSAEVIGTETDFAETDVDREIVIAGEVYVIARVGSTTTLTLTEDYRGETTERVHYAIGVKLVGTPWPVRLPTSLVILQPDATLPRERSSAGSSATQGSSAQPGNSGCWLVRFIKRLLGMK
jgi:hypothetical protein